MPALPDLLARAGALAIVAGGVLATLTLVVFLISAMPNGSERDIRLLTGWTIAAAAGGLVAAVIGSVLTFRGRAGVAALVGASPMIVLAALMVWVSAS